MALLSGNQAETAQSQADTALFIQTSEFDYQGHEKVQMRLSWRAALEAFNPRRGAMFPGITLSLGFACIVISGCSSMMVTSTGSSQGVSQTSPQISWANPPAIVTGTALSAAQLDASANVPGTFTYNQTIGAVLPAGSHTLSATFTPTDTTAYTTATASATLLVAPPVGSNLWTAPAVGSVNSLGTVSVPLNGQGLVGVLQPTIAAGSTSLVCTGSSWDTSGTVLTIAYSVGTETIHVTASVSATSTGVSAELNADQPLITSVDMGKWATSLNVQKISVPYYTGNVWYAANVSSFLNDWWDWHTTNATAFSGTAAQYRAKTDGTLNTMHELLEVAASPNVDSVFPSPGNSPSPYMATMAGRLVLDIWDGGFAGIQQNLANLNDYGIGNCIGIIHNWQYAGYDNALPQHYSANESLGGSTSLQAAIAQGAKNGCLMGVHENYVDYYPNYPQFNSAAVAANGDGSQMLSWLNASTGIQSFATKTSWMVQNAQTQSPLIHEAYGTAAGYLDVNSAVVPSWHADMDSNSPNAGMLTALVQNSQSLWAYERKTHGGPVLGEGANHWYYSGLLDGVEAQLGAGSVAMNLDKNAPLFVDFDVLRIHPLQINHGMGYYSRWTSTKTPSMTTEQMDAYRMQEVAFGHAPFLSDGTWSDIAHALVESNLVSPVAASYGTVQASSVQYGVNGSWVSSSIAAQSSQFTQVQVAYDNGVTLVANSASESLNWNGLTIPQYGWAAKGDNLLAYTAMCGSTICDYSQTGTSLFANARNQADEELGSGVASPSVTSISHVNARAFSIAYNWQVYCTPVAENAYKAFVHFVNDSLVTSGNDGIVFQNDHWPLEATAQWAPNQTIDDGPFTVSIPSSVPDGTYSIRVGLYDPATGQRLQLTGNNDGTERYIVGYLVVSGGGSKVSFTAPAAPSNDPRLNSAGTIVDFGSVRTDGMLSMTQENGQWVLRPFPRYRNFTIYLNSDDYPMPSSVQAAGTTTSTVIPLASGSQWQLPLNGSKTYTWPVN